MRSFERFTRRALTAAAAVTAFGAGTPLLAQTETCPFQAERTGSADAAGAELLEVVARAGGLTVRGVPGSTEVRVRGRACASSEEAVAEIGLSVERRGAEVRVAALMPESSTFRNGYARLDLVVEVPAGIAANIEDSSGPMELARLGELTVDDSSGEIRIEDVSGSVRIDDSSGGIHVARVSGDVEIDDSSGIIVVRDVEGSVAASDSSGEIDVGGVRGSVTVHRDSSGPIRVEDIGGDFVVKRDSSGGVSYRNVAGTVRLPRDD